MYNLRYISMEGLVGVCGDILISLFISNLFVLFTAHIYLIGVAVNKCLCMSLRPNVLL